MFDLAFLQRQLQQKDIQIVLFDQMIAYSKLRDTVSPDSLKCCAKELKELSKKYNIELDKILREEIQ